jgi:hypothetical protein
MALTNPKAHSAYCDDCRHPLAEWWSTPNGRAFLCLGCVTKLRASGERVEPTLSPRYIQKPAKWARVTIGGR